LGALKNKSKDQDSRMTQDTRIVVLESQLIWFKNEFESLLKVKAAQDTKVEAAKTEVAELTKETQKMSAEVKAARR
jgi:uncharacterized coiled-coil protein SlyX